MSQHASDDGGGGQPSHQHHALTKGEDDAEEEHTSSHAGNAVDKSAEKAHSDEDRSPATPAQHNVDKQSAEGEAALHAMTPHESTAGSSTSTTSTTTAESRSAARADEDAAAVRPVRLTPARALLAPTLRVPLRLRRPRRMDLPLRIGRPGNTGANDAASANGTSSTNSTNSNNTSARESLRRMSMRATGLHHYNSSNHHHYYYYYYHNPHGPHSHRVTPRTTALTTPNGSGGQGHAALAGGALVSPREATTVLRSPESPAAATAAAATMTTSPLTQHTVPVQPAGRHSGAGTAAAMPSSEAATQPAVDATQHPSQQQQQQQERGLMPAAERYGRRPHPRPTTTGVHSHRGMPVAGLGADLGIGRNADARVYLNTNVMHVHRNARHGPRRWTTSSPAPTTTTATTHTSAAVANAGNAAARATRPSTATTLLPRQTSAAVDEAAVGRSPSQSQHRHSLIAFSANDATSPTELNTNVAYPAQSLFSPSCVSLPGLLSSCTTPAPAPLQISAETRSPFSETNTTATSTPAAAASRAMSAATRPANITITTTRHASAAGGSQRVASAHSASRPAAQPPPPLLTTTIASTEGSSGQLAGEAAPNVSDTTPRDMDEVEERALLLPWESCSHSTLFRSAPAPAQAAAAAVTTMSLRAAHNESARDTSVRSKASSRTGEEERAASRRSARAATHDETSDAGRAQPSSPYGRTSSSAEHVAPSTNNKKKEEEEDNKAAALQEETQHEPSAVVPGAIANIVTTTTTTTSAGNASASNAGAANNNNNNNVTTTSFSVTTQKLGISGSSPLLSSQTSGLSSSLAHSVQISSIEDAISAVTRTPLTNASPPGIATHSFASAPHTTASPQVSSAPTAPTAAAAGTALFGFFGMLERATCFQEFAVLRRLYDVELRPFLEQVTEHIFAIEGHSSVARVHNHLMQLFFTSCENEKVGEEFYSDPTNSWPLHVLYLICCFYITASRCGYGRLYAAMQRSGGLLTLGKGMFAALAVAMAPRAEDLPRTTANMYLAAFYVGALMRRQQRRLEPALEDVTQRYFALLLVNIPVFTLRQLVEQVNSGRCGSLFTTAATAAANSTGNHPNAGHETSGGNHAASGSLGRSTTSIATNTTTTMTTTSCLSTTMPHSEIEVSRIISSRSAIVCGHPLDLLRLDIVLTRYADFNGIKIHKDYLPATAPENSGYYNRSMVFDLLAYWHTKGIAFCPNQLHLRLFSPCNGEVWSAEAFSNARRGASSGNASAAATAAMMNACSNDNVGGGAARFARCVAEAATYRNQDLTYSLHHLHDRDVLLDFSMHALSVGPLIAWANKEITILSVPTNRREGSVLPPPRRSAQDSAMLGTLYKLSVINDILHQVPVRMRPCAETPIGGVELFTTFEQLGLLRVVKAATVPAEHDYQPSPNEPPATQHTRQESAKERRAAAQHVPSEAAAAAARGAGDVRSAHDDADGDAARADRVDERSGTIDLSVHTPPRHDEAVAEDTAHDKDEALHEAHEEGRGGEGEGSAEGSAALPSMYCSCSSTSSSASAPKQPQRRAAATIITTTTTMTAVTTSAVTSGEADTEEASPLSHVVPRRSHAQSAPHERYTSEAATTAAAATTATTSSNPPPSTASQTDKALTSSSSTTNASALPSSQAASSDWISLMSGPHSTSNVAAVVAAVAGAARLYAARSHNTHNASGTAPPTAFPSPPFTPSPLPLGSSAVVPATTSTTSVASADLNDAAASLLVLHGGAPLPQSALAVGHEGVATAAASSSSSSALYARGEAAAGSGRAGASEMFLCSEDYVIQRNPHFADVINVFKVSETIKYYEMQFGCVLREGALRFATLLKERTGMDFPLYMLLMCPNVFTLLEMWDGYIFIERWCSDSED